MKTYLSITALSLVVLLSGCSSMYPKEVANPKEITLEQALADVGSGLRKLHEEQKGVKTGLIADSVEITFNVKASANEDNKLTIDLSRDIVVPEVTSHQAVGGEAKSHAEGVRENTITIKFKNIVTLPKDSLAANKSPDEVGKLIETFKEFGLVHYPQ